MSADANTKTIMSVYEAFGRGDVAAILDAVTDDVDWASEAAGTAAPPGLPQLSRSWSSGRARRSPSEPGAASSVTTSPSSTPTRGWPPLTRNLTSCTVHLRSSRC